MMVGTLRFAHQFVTAVIACDKRDAFAREQSDEAFAFLRNRAYCFARCNDEVASSACDKATRRANHPKLLSIPSRKNIPLSLVGQINRYNFARLTCPDEGRFAIVTNVR